jgi:D-glycero-D-manno-heptose 1,7-bisphosphate phosphatase
MSTPPPRPAAFLDRDGTLIEEVNYLHRPEQVRLVPGVRDALVRLRAEGVALVVVTNQSGVARGYFSPQDVHAVHAHLETLLGLRFDGVYACFHHPRGEVPAWAGPCACRKPSPGMLERAASELALDLATSAMFGDKVSDLGAGRALRMPAFLVGTGHGPAETPAARRAGYPIHPDLPDAIAAWRGW